MSTHQRPISAALINRQHLLAALRSSGPWDVLVIGGGATGLGIAVDAAARGFRTALIEARDFAGGTSGRSTKLIHGGVRYLAQGNIKLVQEGLSERALLLDNAPQLVKPLKFIVPCYRPLEREMMRVGLGIYDGLAGKRGIGETRWLSRTATRAELPGVREHGLYGGVAYWDARFDDARLAIALMRTAVRLDAVAINYVAADGVVQRDGRIDAILARDNLSGERFELHAKAIFNASGVWADSVRRLADPAAIGLTTLSRGSHIVLPGSFMPGDAAMMIPRTGDGRVLFAIPWANRLLVGTTDVATDETTWEPAVAEAEIGFIVETARRYLQASPSAGDVLAAFAGLRPLFSPHVSGPRFKLTKSISREHAIAIEHQNLVTIVGGKWTTYRRMALDALDQAADAGLLPGQACTTASIKLDVDDSIEAAFRAAQSAALDYQSSAVSDDSIAAYVELAVRHEQARSVDDVVSRRLRVQLLDQRASARLRAQVEQTLASQLHRAGQ